jgi:Asp-tRNA(Asn)/Glu-tRNA(Gln) amidotransferase A subunit family amidase
LSLHPASISIKSISANHCLNLDTTGNNPIYGTPRNPYNPEYYTGGSSSGSGYAVATGLIPFALGSDGGGSVRIPSSFCGVFGLKPSHGRLSFRPGPNHSITCASNGPVAADIQSLTTALNVISQPDPSSDFPPHIDFQITASVNDKKIIGMPRAWFSDAAPVVQKLCQSMVDRLVSEYGYTVVDIEIPFLPEGQVAHAMTVLTDGATLLPDTGNLTAGNKLLLALGRTTPSTDYLLAQKLRSLLMRHLAYLWKTYPGMIIVTPTTGCPGWRIQTKGELQYGLSDGDLTIESMRYVWLGNFCGLPALTVPAGYVVPEGRPNAGEIASMDELGKVPIGLMASGEWTSEQNLIHFGLAAEALGEPGRSRPPNWVDTIALARDEMKRAGTENLIDF